MGKRLIQALGMGRQRDRRRRDCDAVYLSLDGTDRRIAGIPPEARGFLFWPPWEEIRFSGGIGEFLFPPEAFVVTLKKINDPSVEIIEHLPVCPETNQKRVVFPDSLGKDGRGARFFPGGLELVTRALKEDGFPKLAALIHLAHTLQAHPNPQTVVEATIDLLMQIR